MKNCKECINARFSNIDRYIGCSFLYSKHKGNLQKIMEDLNLEDIEYGWVYTHRNVNSLQNNSIGSGILTNNVPIFKKDFKCKYLKKESL